MYDNVFIYLMLMYYLFILYKLVMFIYVYLMILINIIKGYSYMYINKKYVCNRCEYKRTTCKKC